MAVEGRGDAREARLASSVARVDELEFGGMLRQRREAAGLSRHALALRCGMRESAISQLERGLRDPQLSTIVRLACGLGMTPAELIRTPATRGQ